VLDCDSRSQQLPCADDLLSVRVLPSLVGRLWKHNAWLLSMQCSVKMCGNFYTCRSPKFKMCLK
jgi:hypothetical protein